MILPTTSPIYRAFAQAVARQKMVFFAGLPGAGKSLLLQQMALMAEQVGRPVHLLQWDVTRAVFETAENLVRYPEIDGVTHAVIRKAVGVWARTAVSRWYTRYARHNDLLLGEVPLMGSRLIELVQKQNDEIEPILAGAETLFFVPVPSRRVRQVIEQARERSIAAPRHEKETNDAQPNVMRALWLEVARVGQQLGLAKEGDLQAYNPDVYAAVYRHLLQHRICETLFIDEVLHPAGSAYDLVVSGGELAASPIEVAAVMAKIEQNYSDSELE
ncbi:MAG: hypothetical protein Kow0080_27940 [Candidatus Promineifilaceae bacterium]